MFAGMDMNFGLTEVLLLIGGVGVVIAVIARKFGYGKGYGHGYEDRDEEDR